MNCRRTSAIDAARLYSACRSQVPAVRNAAVSVHRLSSDGETGIKEGGGV